MRLMYEARVCTTASTATKIIWSGVMASVSAWTLHAHFHRPYGASANWACVPRIASAAFRAGLHPGLISPRPYGTRAQSAPAAAPAARVDCARAAAFHPHRFHDRGRPGAAAHEASVP